MNGAYAASPELTAEQRKVVEQPADARVLVTAEAGAGKTHTLVRRLDHLIEEEELVAGEILVLTFSRAAVRELSDRLARHGEAARHVRAKTFDSWALELLLQVDAQGGWEERSFEGRIEGARQAIDDGLADELYADDLLHVVIDEVQDLVGARRELVESLLDTFDCGFTVVGDPAQSIYGFTLGAKATAADRRAETGQFFLWLRNTFADELVELALTQNFRALDEDAAVALPFGPKLRKAAETGADGDDLYVELRNTLRGRLNLGELDEFIARQIGGHESTTAILCRTNGQALQVSEKLYAAQVPHRLQRSARDRVVPAWFGMLFRSVDGTMLTRAQFDALVPSLPLPAETSADLLWRLMLRTGTGRGNDRSIDLGRLRTALATGRLPDELTAQPPARLVISSFHRAKGLEFARVIVVDPGPLRTSESPTKGRSKEKKPYEVDALEEARMLYVAMTRPRTELWWLNALDSRLIRLDREVGRWGRYFWKRWSRLGLEMVGNDVYTEQPAGTAGFEADPAVLQDYLAAEVAPGDGVILERLTPMPIGLRESPDYLIVHRGRPIGITSGRFRAHLYRHMKTGASDPHNWPRLLSGIHVDVVETVAGSEAAGIEAGLGSRGVWLAPRLTGLSTFIYDPKSEEDTHDPAQ